MTPRGIASPHMKTGRYSKSLPTRLLADYESALADPDLIAVREELALLVAREGELVAEIRDRPPGADTTDLWDALLVVIDRRRQLSDTERRRLEAGHRAITAEQAVVLVAALVDAVRRNVEDRGVLAGIERDFSRIVGRDGARDIVGAD